MASIIAMALITPMAMAIDIPIVVQNEPPEIICKCEGPKESVEPYYIYPDLINPEVPKSVMICAMVCDPNGKADISNVYATVYYPNGTVYNGSVPMEPAGGGETCTECTLLRTCDAAPGPTYCAEDPIPGGCCDRPISPVCQLYIGRFGMTMHQPGGEYRVVVTATDLEGDKDNLQNRFFYYSYEAFNIDFSGLKFTDIVICQPSYIPGNDEMENWGEAPPVRPTIHNAGNDPIQIGFNYSFDVDTIKMDVNGHWFNQSKTYWDGILENYCDTMPLNFSLHVEEGTPAGSHSGTIEIKMRPAPRTILLYNKDASDSDLYKPNLSGPKGELTYDYNTCKFNFTATGLVGCTDYCLIYYPEPWPGTGGCCLGTLNSDCKLDGPLPRIPIAADYDYDRAGYKLGKIWLVPCSDYSEAAGEMTGWTPSKILFDLETIDTNFCP